MTGIHPRSVDDYYGCIRWSSSNAMRFFLHRTNSFEVTLFLVLGYNKCLLLQCPWDMDAPTDNVPFSYEVEYD